MTIKDVLQNIAQKPSLLVTNLENNIQQCLEKTNEELLEIFFRTSERTSDNENLVYTGGENVLLDKTF